MKKIIVIIFAMFLLTSCTFISKKQPVIEEDIRKGTQGLVMNFVKGTPPETVYESAEGGYEGIFDISVTLENKGATNIRQGYLTINYEEDYITYSPDGGWIEGDYSVYGAPQDKTMRFTLKGKSTDNPIGEIKIVSNKLKTKMLEELSEEHDSLLLITCCYDYSTVESAVVCIDPNPYEAGVKACTVKDITFTSQGAPVAITKIETAMLSAGGGRVKPEFKIYIRNKGAGKVVNKDKIDIACKAKISDEEKVDLWNIIDIKLGLGRQEGSEYYSPFECTPVPMKLRGEEDFVRCVYEGTLSATTAYQTPLIINLTYGYTHTISKQFKIIKNPSLHVPYE